MRAVKQTCVLLRTPGSPLGDSLGRHLEEHGLHAALLDLDAPLRGEPVTVHPDRVLWQGTDLSAAAAILVERPVFPWPQPRCIEGLIHDGVPDQDRAGAMREAWSLVASAIPAAACRGRVINPPAAAHLAASPAIALAGLGEAGLPVHPWRLAPAPDEPAGRLLLDAAGRDLAHEPGRPGPRDLAVEADPVRGDVLFVLTAGGVPLGGLRFADAAAWLERSPEAALPPERIPAAAAELSARAIAALGLAFGGVSVIPAEGAFRLLWLDAGPDLADWDARLEGRVARGLADFLIDIATGEGERHR